MNPQKNELIQKFANVILKKKRGRKYTPILRLCGELGVPSRAEGTGALLHLHSGGGRYPDPGRGTGSCTSACKHHDCSRGSEKHFMQKQNRYLKKRISF
jgi:hypothetical protein